MSRGTIVHISSAHNKYNFRIYHRELIALRDEGYSTVYITPNTEDDHEEGIIFKKFDIPKNKITRVFTSSFKVSKLINSLTDVSVINIHSPELIPVGIIQKFQGKKIVYEAHDNLPAQVYTKDWIPSFLKPLFSLGASIFEGIANLTFDKIIIIEPTNAARFKKEKVEIIRNYPISDEFDSIDVDQFKKRPNNLVYIGQINKPRGIIDYVKCLELIPDELNVRLQLGGPFRPASLQNKLEQMEGWKKVDYHGYMSREEVIKTYSESKIGLLVLEPNKKYKKSDPVKLFEYMAAGIPFIMSDFELWKELIDHSDIAETCEFSNASQLSEIIQSMLLDPDTLADKSRRNIELYKAKYRWEEQKVKYLDLFENLVSN